MHGPVYYDLHQFSHQDSDQPRAHSVRRNMQQYQNRKGGVIIGANGLSAFDPVATTDNFDVDTDDEDTAIHAAPRKPHSCIGKCILWFLSILFCTVVFALMVLPRFAFFHRPIIAHVLHIHHSGDARYSVSTYDNVYMSGFPLPLTINFENLRTTKLLSYGQNSKDTPDTPDGFDLGTKLRVATHVRAATATCGVDVFELIQKRIFINPLLLSNITAAYVYEDVYGRMSPYCNNLGASAVVQRGSTIVDYAGFRRELDRKIPLTDPVDMRARIETRSAVVAQAIAARNYSDAWLHTYAPPARAGVFRAREETAPEPAPGPVGHSGVDVPLRPNGTADDAQAIFGSPWPFVNIAELAVPGSIVTRLMVEVQCKAAERVAHSPRNRGVRAQEQRNATLDSYDVQYTPTFIEASLNTSANVSLHSDNVTLYVEVVFPWSDDTEYVFSTFAKRQDPGHGDVTLGLAFAARRSSRVVNLEVDVRSGYLTGVVSVATQWDTIAAWLARNVFSARSWVGGVVHRGWFMGELGDADAIAVAAAQRMSTLPADVLGSILFPVKRVPQEAVLGGGAGDGELAPRHIRTERFDHSGSPADTCAQIDRTVRGTAEKMQDTRRMQHIDTLDWVFPVMVRWSLRTHLLPLRRIIGAAYAAEAAGAAGSDTTPVTASGAVTLGLNLQLVLHELHVTSSIQNVSASLIFHPWNYVETSVFVVAEGLCDGLFEFDNTAGGVRLAVDVAAALAGAELVVPVSIVHSVNKAFAKILGGVRATADAVGTVSLGADLRMAESGVVSVANAMVCAAAGPLVGGSAEVDVRQGSVRARAVGVDGVDVEAAFEAAEFVPRTLDVRTVLRHRDMSPRLAGVVPVFESAAMAFAWARGVRMPVWEMEVRRLALGAREISARVRIGSESADKHNISIGVNMTAGASVAVEMHAKILQSFMYIPRVVEFVYTANVSRADGVGGVLVASVPAGFTGITTFASRTLFPSVYVDLGAVEEHACSAREAAGSFDTSGPACVRLDTNATLVYVHTTADGRARHALALDYGKDAGAARVGVKYDSGERAVDADWGGSRVPSLDQIIHNATELVLRVFVERWGVLDVLAVSTRNNSLAAVQVDRIAFGSEAGAGAGRRTADGTGVVFVRSVEMQNSLRNTQQFVEIEYVLRVFYANHRCTHEAVAAQGWSGARGFADWEESIAAFAAKDVAACVAEAPPGAYQSGADEMWVSLVSSQTISGMLVPEFLYYVRMRGGV